MPKTIGIVGTRRRDEQADLQSVINAFLPLLQPGDKIVSGGCPKGADKFAQELAKEYGLTIIIHYPNWQKYGRGAGVIRNETIAKDCDVLIACVAEDRTGGTEYTVKEALKLSKPVVYC